MTQVARNADQKTRLMRRIARVLAVIWAAGWTPCVVAALWIAYLVWVIDMMPPPSPPAEWWLALVFMLSVAWVPTAIAWRPEAIGGIVLVVEGLLVLVAAGWLVWILDVYGFLDPQLGGWDLGILQLLLAAFALLFFAGLPLGAGSLLLASWRRSKRSEIRPGCE